MLAGGGLGALGVYEYFDFTEFEQSGGTRQVSKMTKMAYEMGGKWGVVGLTMAFAVLLLGVGIWTYMDEKKKVNTDPK
jgi:hypothetical protein